MLRTRAEVIKKGAPIMTIDRRTNDNPSTYFVQDRKNKKELTRLSIQDQMITAGMGGVLPEQPNPIVFHHALDVGCGTGGWLIETAKVYPTMSLTGIDISQRMIEYARTQAKEHQVNHQVAFHVMDTLGKLEFSDNFFDLVNLRFGLSFLRTWDWLKVLMELLRVTRPGGVLRITEGEALHQSNSPALTRLFEMNQCALFRSGHLFTQESSGLLDHLPQLLDQSGVEQLQIKPYNIEYRAGTKERDVYRESITLAFQTLRPFIHKWNCASLDYETTYQQALSEMHHTDFLATVHLFTAWGYKPKPKS
jgi:ubiquinone/menaquinone biosynthesis C-methylase UbiE